MIYCTAQLTRGKAVNRLPSIRYYVDRACKRRARLSQFDLNFIWRVKIVSILLCSLVPRPRPSTRETGSGDFLGILCVSNHVTHAYAHAHFSNKRVIRELRIVSCPGGGVWVAVTREFERDNCVISEILQSDWTIPNRAGVPRKSTKGTLVDFLGILCVSNHVTHAYAHAHFSNKRVIRELRIVSCPGGGVWVAVTREFERDNCVISEILQSDWTIPNRAGVPRKSTKVPRPSFRVWAGRSGHETTSSGPTRFARHFPGPFSAP